MTERTTIDLDISHDPAERAAREDAYNGRFRERIVEVLRKYGIALDDAPLSALAMAMARMRQGSGSCVAGGAGFSMADKS